ncbi:MAG TPA: response regulator [Blastocatellia bacterium]|nr:response regulator [Blastocatellia bacterium]
MNAKRILVVDDSPIELRLTSRLLAQAGYETVTALTGEQALRFALEVRVDGILLDIHMPGMDGFEVCRLLKENPTTARLPVILYSVRDQVTDVLQGEEVGADDFVAKSAGKERLLRSLEHLLGRCEDSELPGSRFDFSSLEPVAARLAPDVLARTISREFARTVRPILEEVLDAPSAEQLLNLAIKKVANRFSFFGESASSYPFVEERLGNVSVSEILEGFGRLADAIDALMAKVAAAGVYTAGHLRAVTPTHADEVRSALGTLIQRVCDVILEQSRGEEPDSRIAAPGPSEADRAMAEVAARTSGASRTFVIHLDGDGLIVNSDATVLEILGYDQMTLLGSYFQMIVDESSHDDLASLLASVKATGHGEGTLVFKKHNGDRLSGRISLAALYDPLGQFVMARGRIALGISESGAVGGL